MARPRISLPAPDAVRALIDERGLLAVRVTPNASADALSIEAGQLRARVTAVPEGGKANRAVIALVSRALGTPPARIELVRGATARDKALKIAD